MSESGALSVVRSTPFVWRTMLHNICMSSNEGGNNVVVRPATIVSTVTMHVPRIGLRSYMSTWMLRSAMRFTDRAQAIEDEHPGDWASPHAEEHMDHVIAAVMGAATFMEAMVNELFTDAADEEGLTGDGYLASLAAEPVWLMGDWWRESGEGMDKTLAKYQLLLSFAGKPKFDKGADPFQSAALLLKLRNTLVHFRPETVWSDETPKLEKQLKGLFAGNGLIDPKSRRWPNGVLGAGCARWSNSAARSLADETCLRLGISANYQRVLGR